MKNILFSDVASFHVCGLVNHYNSRIRSDEEPHATFEWERNTPKVNLWLGFTKTKVYGSFMFAEQFLV